MLRAIDVATSQLFTMTVLSPMQTLHAKMAEGLFDEALEMAQRFQVHEDVVRKEQWRWLLDHRTQTSSVVLLDVANDKRYGSGGGGESFAADPAKMPRALVEAHSRWRSERGALTLRDVMTVLDVVTDDAWVIDEAITFVDTDTSVWAEVLAVALKRTDPSTGTHAQVLAQLKGSTSFASFVSGWRGEVSCEDVRVCRERVSAADAMMLQRRRRVLDRTNRLKVVIALIARANANDDDDTGVPGVGPTSLKIGGLVRRVVAAVVAVPTAAVGGFGGDIERDPRSS